MYVPTWPYAVVSCRLLPAACLSSRPPLPLSCPTYCMSVCCVYAVCLSTAASSAAAQDLFGLKALAAAPKR